MFDKDHRELLTGVVEVEETYIGGEPRKQGFVPRPRGTKKAPVVGMVQRGGLLRARN
ncbi:MAG: transposase [Candidatus Scalinduaceae bacterium]